MRKVTMQDVAEKAGVSKSTVSQYLNERFEYMGQATKEKIKAAIEELGYQPNVLARSLKQKKTLTIGIIVANILHHFSTQITRAIEDYCHSHQYHVIICNADDQPEKEKQYIDMLRAKQVDGIILLPTGKNIALYRELEKQGYPLLFIDRAVEEINVHTIVLNNRDAAMHAVEYFYGKGHERIAMMTTPVHVSVRAERVRGYQEAVRLHQLPQMNEYLSTAPLENTEQALLQMMALSHPPTALLVGNDLVLIEILKTVRKHDIRIPDQLSLITFDETQFAELYDPPLTTIAQPAYAMGKKAAELLLKQINQQLDDEDQRSFVFQAEFLERESVKKLI
nr:LacI family DNA-binding transcriptional regulator [Evansella caseinilytica]